MSRKRQAIPQFEFGFQGEPFALVAESAPDGERIARERSQSNEDRARSEARQTEIETKPGLSEGSAWHTWKGAL